jgi:hypothetical protein
VLWNLCLPKKHSQSPKETSESPKETFQLPKEASQSSTEVPQPPKETSPLSKYDIGVSSSHSVMRAIIALVQLYSIVTYIRHESRQNRINDYAAYQLTLIPYGLMSVVNILCGIFTPTYSAVYMVDSTIMEEARGRGWVFDGTIGELCETDPFIKGDDTKGQRKDAFVYRVTFEGNQKDEHSKGNQTNTSANAEGDQGMEIGPGEGNEMNTSTKATGGQPREINLGCGSIKCGTSRRTDNSSDVVRHLIDQIVLELPVIRWLFVEWKPGARPIELFSKQVPIEADQIMFSPIGNPTIRKVKWRNRMLVVSQAIFLVSLALPYVITWVLTDFKAPKKGKLNGAVFLVWLVFGQFCTVPTKVIWRFVHSIRVNSKSRKWWYALSILLTSVWSIPAIWGFILVGREQYRASYTHGGQSIRTLKVREPRTDLNRISLPVQPDIVRHNQG